MRLVSELATNRANLAASNAREGVEASLLELDEQGSVHGRSSTASLMFCGRLGWGG